MFHIFNNLVPFLKAAEGEVNQAVLALNSFTQINCDTLWKVTFDSNREIEVKTQKEFYYT